MKYVKKPVEIEAIQWDGLNLNEILEFVGENLKYEIFDEAWRLNQAPPYIDMKIHTLEGDMEVSKGDYIIKGVRGEFYPCKPDIFNDTYRLVDETNKTYEVTIKDEGIDLVIKDLIMGDKYVTFWGSCFSNFYPTSFILNDIVWKSSEQCFMWLKAKTFNDEEIATKILQCNTPKEAKKSGRQIKEFSDEVWDKVKETVMHEVVYAKFSQNPLLKRVITNSAFNGKYFVEGNPFDKVWAVALDWRDPRIMDETNWQGENLLGKVLDKVRAELM